MRCDVRVRRGHLRLPRRAREADPATALYAEHFRAIDALPTDFESFFNHKVNVLQLIYGAAYVVDEIEKRLTAELDRMNIRTHDSI